MTNQEIIAANTMRQALKRIAASRAISKAGQDAMPNLCAYCVTPVRLTRNGTCDLCQRGDQS